ncbi:MAG TPA: hypothetical protein VK470_11150, partial [Bacteroidota bacterium]|nr:hypothetical protein [Bacteroidota bacterium]
MRTIPVSLLVAILMACVSPASAQNMLQKPKKMLPVVVPSTQPAQQGLASGGTSSPSMIAKNLNAFLASLGVKPA